MRCFNISLIVQVINWKACHASQLHWLIANMLCFPNSLFGQWSPLAQTMCDETVPRKLLYTEKKCVLLPTMHWWINLGKHRMFEKYHINWETSNVSRTAKRWCFPYSLLVFFYSLIEHMWCLRHSLMTWKTCGASKQIFCWQWGPLTPIMLRGQPNASIFAQRKHVLLPTMQPV